MKQMYFLLFTLLAAHTAVIARDDASNMTTATTGQPSGTGGGFPHFNAQGNSLGKVAQSYRLVARTNTAYDGNSFVPVDSTNYIYSNGRASIVDQDQPEADEFVQFDQSITFRYNATQKQYDNLLYRKQTFNADNAITSLTYSLWRNTTSEWKDSARYIYSYISGTNKMDASTFQLNQAGGMWVSHNVSSLTYNGNYVTDVNSEAYAAVFTYDANNNILSIEDKVFDHSTFTLYNNQHKEYTYDALNAVTSYLLKTWDIATSAWKNTKRWEYTNVDGRVVTSLEYNWDGSTWIIATRHTYSYVNVSDKKSELIEFWDAPTKSFVNYTNEVWAYNTQNLVTSITLNNWDKATGSWKNINGNGQQRFYYEYYAPTGINTVANNVNMNVFPLPASASVNLHINWPSPQQFNVAIYDMAGRIVMNWNEEAKTLYKKEINVAAFADGNYIVKATAGNTILTNKIVVKK